MITTFEEFTPQLGPAAWVADSAEVMGRVTLGEAANVWYGTVLRGDVGEITVGARTNLQDLTVVHVTTDTFDTHIGNDVTVGHRVILHGCTVHDHVLIGMGAIVMDGASIGEWSFVGAGSLVTPGTIIPPGSMVMGSPARVVRAIKDSEREWITYSVGHYVELAQRHDRARRSNAPG